MAADYAAQLLQDLGCCVDRNFHASLPSTPALDWQRSGLWALAGTSFSTPLLPLPARVEGVRLAMRALLQTLGQNPTNLPDARTLSERAVLMDRQAQVRRSAGGGCRILRCLDDWLALSLPRNDDWQLLEAWLEKPLELQADNEANWRLLENQLLTCSSANLLERGRLLGLALARVGHAETLRQPARWRQHITHAPAGQKPLERWRPPLVIELASLWAGPLCGHLLQQMGARVIKVESLQRPDGARQGESRFFDLMNGGKESLALDFQQHSEVQRLRKLLAQADIIIEGSRPRALRQLGIIAEELLSDHPQLTWLAINGYGRTAETENWIAYGDDAGVAAGLTGLMLDLELNCNPNAEPAFYGDAIADPLTGWHAALAGLAGFLAGGGGLLSLSLCEVTRYCAQFQLPATRAELELRQREWPQQVAGLAAVLPLSRQPCFSAPALGADTAAICTEFAL